ncbi:MAG: hypothetical protein QW081_00130 [Desulfurococcaceae archaeon]
MTQRIKPIALFTDTDAKAMGVYLALLYLRFDKDFTNYSQKPTAYEMVQEYTFKYMWFNKYFERRAADGREAINAAIAFINKLFEHEEMLSSKIEINFLTIWKQSSLRTLLKHLKIS